jgi:hypothetical protein
MSKITVEIDDTLPDRVQSAIDGVKAELLNYCEENKPDKLPDLGNDLDYSGAIHEIIDGSVPIYTKELTDTWYLYGDKCEQAFDDAGIGEKVDGAGWPMGWKAAAICCYIEQQVHEWYSENAKAVFEAWKAKQP